MDYVNVVKTWFVKTWTGSADKSLVTELAAEFDTDGIFFDIRLEPYLVAAGELEDVPVDELHVTLNAINVLIMEQRTPR